MSPKQLIEYERYKIIAENTLDVIILVDNDGIVRYVSPSIQTVLGYTAEQYMGMNAFDIIPSEERDKVQHSHVEAMQTKTPVELEYWVIHSNGTTIYVETRVKPVLDLDGNVEYVVAVVRDITKRKLAEQLLENILDSVHAGVFSTDKDFTRHIYCSESVEKMTGLPREEVMNNPIRMHDVIHPDDNAAMFSEVKVNLDKGNRVEKDIRFIHIENETRWGRMIVHPIKDHTGEIARLDGIILDITDLKRSELALEEQEQRYKSLFEHNLDGAFSIDLQGNFVSANGAFENITGIQIDKLPDRCFIGLIYDEDHVPVFQVLSEVMQMREPRDVECRMIPSKRGERIVNITFVPIFLRGELNGVHGIVKDITDKKREERDLIESEERNRILQQSLNRFSNDLKNVMKVSDLENRLMEEVHRVLSISDVSIKEIPREQELALSQENEIFIKIAEKEQIIYLRICSTRSLLKIEKEWLETVAHYATILYDNLQFIEDLTRRFEEMVASNVTPKWMLRLLFRLSEKERASLSSDLHDSVLQDLIIWYRRLESLRSSTLFDNEIKGELIQIEEGLLDAIHQIRVTCNELRPPFLLKLGLVESLKSLFSYSRMFSNFEIEFTSSELETPLNEDQILGMYRIVQELLNNATKHSKASKVTMALTGGKEQIHFCYRDNGVGMDLTGIEGSFKNMGIAGMENRVLSLEGEMKVESAPQEGFHVDLYIPIKHMQKGDDYGNIIGG